MAIDARVLGQRGVGRYLSNLLAGFARSRQANEYLLYLGSQSQRELIPQDPRFKAIDLGSAHPAWAEQLSIPRLARAAGADLLHYPDNTGAVFAGLPTVLTLHDTMWRRPLSQAIAHPTLRQRIQDRYRKLICPWAAGRARALITISQHSAQDITQALGIPASKLSVIREDADPYFKARAPLAPAQRTVRQLGIKGPYVLASGAADKRKNIDRLIAAFAQASHSGPLKGASLVVTSLRAGEAATTTYAVSARRAGIADRVRFLGYVSDAQLRALYRCAKVYAFPSLWEGFGLPALEALAQGTPVLAARAGALPETAGPAAIYSDPLDVASLAQGLSQAAGPAGRRALKSAKGVLSRYSWDKCAAQTLQAYAKACAP